MELLLIFGPMLLVIHLSRAHSNAGLSSTQDHLYVNSCRLHFKYAQYAPVHPAGASGRQAYGTP
jgi:hypothetical protein